MAQSRRHVYSRVSGPDLGWPWEGCWGRPGCLWTLLLWGVGRWAGTQLGHSERVFAGNPQGPVVGELGQLPLPDWALDGDQQGLTWDPTWLRPGLPEDGQVVVGMQNGAGGSARPCTEACFWSCFVARHLLSLRDWICTLCSLLYLPSSRKLVTGVGVGDVSEFECNTDVIVRSMRASLLLQVCLIWDSQSSWEQYLHIPVQPFGVGVGEGQPGECLRSSLTLAGFFLKPSDGRGCLEGILWNQ